MEIGVRLSLHRDHGGLSRRWGAKATQTSRYLGQHRRETDGELVPRTEYDEGVSVGESVRIARCELSLHLMRGVLLTSTTVSDLRKASKGSLPAGAEAANGDEDGPGSEPESSPVA